MSEVTQLIEAIHQGNKQSTEKLLPLVYDELRRLAAGRIASERPGQTLQATALVHEAYMRLVGDDGGPQWNGRAHFFGAAAEAMRRILVDAARRKGRIKRGGDMDREELELDGLVVEPMAAELLAVNEVLDELAEFDEAKAELVKLRFFAGFTLAEAAEILGISAATADRHWAYARAWLADRLSEEGIVSTGGARASGN
jgi:RNA polymerase sigma factor (TIGR02999 family)